jgi:hypothetical protein
MLSDLQYPQNNQTPFRCIIRNTQVIRILSTPNSNWIREFHPYLLSVSLEMPRGLQGPVWKVRHTDTGAQIHNCSLWGWVPLSPQDLLPAFLHLGGWQPCSGVRHPGNEVLLQLPLLITHHHFMTSWHSALGPEREQGVGSSQRRYPWGSLTRTHTHAYMHTHTHMPTPPHEHSLTLTQSNCYTHTNGVLYHGLYLSYVLGELLFPKARKKWLTQKNVIQKSLYGYIFSMAVKKMYNYFTARRTLCSWLIINQ